ncbi:MAG: hypothetical protein QM756_16095 [Polyangiaceae bacterium]
MSDQERGVDPDEVGWSYKDELMCKLKCNENTLNVYMHSARRAGRDTGLFTQGSEPIERRFRQLRLGVARHFD